MEAGPVAALVVISIFVVVVFVVLFTGLDAEVRGVLQERRLRKEWWNDVAQRRRRRR